MAYTFSQRVTLAVVPRLASLLIRVVGATLRYQDVFAPDYHWPEFMHPGDGDPIPGHAIPGPTVFAFWHRSLLTCAHRFRHRDIAILISRSFDGELIARTVERLGFRAIRGSSSRGGAAGLRNMVEAYNSGLRCAFTADGPRGPNMVAQPGPVQLAQLVEAPWVGTFYALPLRAWELKSWDRFLIPKPFSRVVMTWPAHIPEELVTLPAVQKALDQAVAMAEAAR